MHQGLSSGGAWHIGYTKVCQSLVLILPCSVGSGYCWSFRDCIIAELTGSVFLCIPCSLFHFDLEIGGQSDENMANTRRPETH